MYIIYPRCDQEYQLQSDEVKPLAQTPARTIDSKSRDTSTDSVQVCQSH